MKGVTLCSTSAWHYAGGIESRGQGLHHAAIALPEKDNLSHAQAQCCNKRAQASSDIRPGE
jgi:hypothetical protein